MVLNASEDEWQASPLPPMRTQPHESCVMQPSVLQDYKLPPIWTLDWNYQTASRNSWNGTSNARAQINKKSPRRASSVSPIIPQLLQPRYTRPTAEEEVPSRSSCNQPYNRAQIDWIRYFKVDLSLSYNAMDKPFAEQWPGESKTGQCFSTRLYRDNWIPRIDAVNNPIYDEKGIVKIEPIKIQEGNEMCIPYSLVDRYPWRAVEYSWVREKDKERAREILSSDGLIDPTESK
jgi:hypothetical protein